MIHDLISASPVAALLFILTSGVFLIFAGLYMFLKPARARMRYLKIFDYGTRFDWFNPGFFLLNPPPLILFRIGGAIVILLGGFIIYCLVAF